MLSGSSILYDLDKTFEENFHNPSFASIKPPIRLWPPKTRWTRFLGFSLASKIGAAACAVTTGQGIALLAQLGFDVLTYKTIQRRAHLSHPLPNIVYVDCESPLTESDGERPLYTRAQAVSTDKIAVSNSFGNACLGPETLVKDITLAKRALSEGQILIVSVYGGGATREAIASEFAETAFFAKQAGADIIELNLSCPNLLQVGEPLYWDVSAVQAVTTRVVRRVGQTPVVIKLGVLPSTGTLLRQVVETIARAGARGISAINAISRRVVDKKQQPVFGKRVFSGISGYPIRPLALQFIKRLVEINQEKRLDLAILGMGGITLPEHFNDCFNCGADLALSATGMMWNPYLALQYHQQVRL